jgi:two-component system NtrC family response regulator
LEPKLLIVDDDEDIRTQMKWALSSDYEVLLAEDRPGALALVEEHRPAVILLDLGLPPQPQEVEEGFAALAAILSAHRHAKVIIITGQADRENALKAIADGAYDFLCKPIDTEELQVILKRAFYVAQLEKDYQEMEERLGAEGFEGMLGTSPQMQKVFSSIRKVATSDAPVLILGESGTGKEVAAMAIHRRSPRRDGPFIPINCSAIPENLLESELFGHEKGSFTGAHVQRKGRIESAAGGTLFLDEIGELPPSLQVKLLRFLQEQRIERVGGREAIDIDTRVLAATNSDLKQSMVDGSFREDLYYRLAVVVIRLPPLRDREGDVPLLANAFLKASAAADKAKLSGFTASAMRAIEAYHWPGNVRELENRIKRATIMAEGRRIKIGDLDLDTVEGVTPTGPGLKEAREAIEREMVQRALARNKGRISRAARDLGISRPTLYELMDKLGLRGGDES